MGDDESGANGVVAFEMDFTPVLKESTIVMVAADPDCVSDQGLLPYELKCPQILLR